MTNTIIRLNGKLSLSEVSTLLMGMLPFETLSDEKKKCIEGDLSGPVVLEFEDNQNYRLDDNPFIVARPITFNGNNAIITGTGKTGLVIMSGQVTVNRLCFEEFHNTVNIISTRGQKIENITFNNCIFKDCSQTALTIGNAESNGQISQVRIDHCEFIGDEKFNEGKADAGTLMIQLCGALINGDEAVENCISENITISGCYFHCDNRMAISTFCGVGGGLLQGTMPHCKNNNIRQLTIENNVFEDSGDATINILAGCSNQSDCAIENVVIRNNKLTKGIWGIYFSASEPLVGNCDNCHIRNVEIIGNEINQSDHIRDVRAAIAVQAGRIDYFDGSSCTNSTVSHMVVQKNMINHQDKAILICGADALLDGPDVHMEDCSVQNVIIENNAISECEEALHITGASHEGRRIDWDYGYPPKLQKFGELLDDDVVATRSKGNSVREIVFKNNQIKGYRYKYLLSALYGYGQGEGQDNIVENVLIENNQFSEGEGRSVLKTIDQDDRLKDAGNNRMIDIRANK